MFKAMSWHDRDYNRYRLTRWQRAEWVGLLPPPATLTLLVVHLIASLAIPRDITAMDPLLALALHPLLARGLFDGVLVLSLLWWLGTRIEQEIGPWRTIATYLFGGAAAALFIESLARLVPAVAGLPTWPVGALAAWSAALWRNPGFDPVSFFGALVPVRRVLLVGWGLLAVLIALRARAAAPTWWLAAVGGGLAAVLESIVAEWVAHLRKQQRRARRLSDPRRSPNADSQFELVEEWTEPDIDEILKKISTSGMASLTKAEREQLEAARRAKLARPTHRQQVR